MIAWFKAKLAAYREKRKISRQIDPDSFRTLATELRELAELAERLWPRKHKFYAKIKRIQAEMEQLHTLASKPEFRRLSSQKRLKLRESLIQSREQLMETVQTAPSPTQTLQ
ncbi:MAG: hypothetical protein D6E12_05865 [Desulfovibrio sp.]|nr:MAG: hypothetical protein D6E12_05865 [Desulfovibrio sp.]